MSGFENSWFRQERRGWEFVAPRHTASRVCGQGIVVINLAAKREDTPSHWTSITDGAASGWYSLHRRVEGESGLP